VPLDENDPPLKKYELKEKSFERVNQPVRETGPSAAHDIHAILQENLGAQRQAGLDELEHRPRRTSRRTIDYWLLLAVGNLVLLGMVASAHFNPLAIVFGAGASFILSLTLTWVMWFVMDKY